MSDPHFTLPKVAIQFGGKERFLCYPNRSIRRARDERKVDVIETFQKGDVLDSLPIMLWTGFIWAEKDLPFDEVENWFLDEGGVLQDKEWALKIVEALTGEKPKENAKQDPPPADGATS